MLNLVASLVDARPENVQIVRLAARLGISTLTGNPEVEKAFETIVAAADRFADLGVWRARLQQIERSVCLIMVKGVPHGTGLLVGPDIVLTARHVIGSELKDSFQSSMIEMRFDYKTDDTGTTLSQGVVFQANRRGLLVDGGPRGLNYALLRIDGQPGAQPIGGMAVESGAILRKWIELPSSFPVMLPGVALVIAHYRESRPLEMAFGTVAELQPLRYRISTGPGSGGAPCFDARSLEPVALHLGRESIDHVMSYGVELDAVIKDLEERGLGHLLYAQFA